MLNPIPVFGGAKKYHYHLSEKRHRNFRTNGSGKISVFVLKQTLMKEVSSNLRH